MKPVGIVSSHYFFVFDRKRSKETLSVLERKLLCESPRHRFVADGEKSKAKRPVFQYEEGKHG